MAVRIPVVISQHARRSGSIADYEEQLITCIVMESGLDATLIADLKSIELDTTDHLCVEGLKGDFALATWESAAYVCTHLHRLGIPSIEIVPVDGSQKTFSGESGITSKKIFFIPLATNVSIDATIQTLKGLLLARSTPVFSIGAPIHRAKTGAVNQPTSQQPTSQQPASQMESSAHKEPSPPVANSIDHPERLVQPVKLTRSQSAADNDFPNIDQLMDELDEFQL